EGIDPLNVAWGLAKNGDMQLTAGILHQKGRLEMQRKNYDIAKDVLAECFLFSEKNKLKGCRINAARALVHCLLMKTAQKIDHDKSVKGDVVMDFDSAWKAITSNNEMHTLVEKILGFLRKEVYPKPAEATRTSTCAFYWMKWGSDLGIKAFNDNEADEGKWKWLPDGTQEEGIESIIGTPTYQSFEKDREYLEKVKERAYSANIIL
ncbi:unnamed protein product, partial [marine sediment metagenome]